MKYGRFVILTGGVLLVGRIADEADVLPRERLLYHPADLRSRKPRVLLLHPPGDDRLVRAVHHVTCRAREVIPLRVCLYAILLILSGFLRGRSTLTDQLPNVLLSPER